MPQRTVLIVDDDQLNRETLGEVIEEMGIRALTGAAGLKGLDIANHTTTDLIVSDVDMPDISGFELMSRVHDLKPTMPVLLMSGRTGDCLDAMALDAGARGFFPKPVSIPSFTALVDEILHLS